VALINREKDFSQLIALLRAISSKVNTHIHIGFLIISFSVSFQ